MAKASATQLGTWAAGAGFGGTDQAVAIAVALAAGGDPAAAQGAWGIGGGGDGQAQANAAFSRFHQSGWSTFPTHINGSFALYQPVAAVSVQQVPAGATPVPTPGTGAVVASGVAGVVSSVDNALGLPDLTALIGGPLTFLENPQTWVRAAKIIVGVLLIGIGGTKFAYDNVGRPFLHGLDRAGDEVALRGQAQFAYPGRRAAMARGGTP
jgi:hypothetical protein